MRNKRNLHNIYVGSTCDDVLCVAYDNGTVFQKPQNNILHGLHTPIHISKVNQQWSVPIILSFSRMLPCWWW